MVHGWTPICLGGQQEPNPINSKGIPSCRICQTRGHRLEECLYLQKTVSAPAICVLFFFFLSGNCGPPNQLGGQPCNMCMVDEKEVPN